MLKKLLIAGILACASFISQAVTVRVLIVFTPDAVSYFGGAYTTVANGQINLMNAALNNSLIPHQVALAGIYLTPVPYFTDLPDLFLTMQDYNILRERDNSNADVVVTVTLAPEGEEYVGLSTGNFSNNPRLAFVLVSAKGFDIYKTMSHELGHIFGAHHDIAHDNTIVPPDTAFGMSINNVVHSPYLFCFYDIMGYSPGCAGVGDVRANYRINYYTNPYVSPTINGIYWGPLGDFVQMNAAATIAANMPSVANYHNTKMSGGIGWIINEMFHYFFF